MSDHGNTRIQVQPQDRLCFRYAPGAGTTIFLHRPSATGSEREPQLLPVDGSPTLRLSFFPFDQCGEFAAFIADISGFTIGASKMAERGDLLTAEFEVCARE